MLDIHDWMASSAKIHLCNEITRYNADFLCLRRARLTGGGIGLMSVRSSLHSSVRSIFRAGLGGLFSRNSFIFEIMFINT